MVANGSGTFAAAASTAEGLIALTERLRILDESGSTMLPKEISNRTRIIVQTRLLSDGRNWQADCSCGWKSRIFRRRVTARRHYESHKDSHK